MEAEGLGSADKFFLLVDYYCKRREADYRGDEYKEHAGVNLNPLKATDLIW